MLHSSAPVRGRDARIGRDERAGLDNTLTGDGAANALSGLGGNDIGLPPADPSIIVRVQGFHTPPPGAPEAADRRRPLSVGAGRPRLARAPRPGSGRHGPSAAGRF